jgi:MoxR-like ATPase
VRAIAQAFGGSYFERLVTKFSTPEELFGPISLKALEQDRFSRITTGKLPEADWAFVDEIFKANSAILNSLLAVCNEKIFHNDGQPVKVPLVTMFGASNELPEGKELEALFDRFILRFEVNYLLRPVHLKSVLTAPEPSISTKLDMKTLRAAQVEVGKIKITDATVDALISIRDALKTEGVIASDRRWKKSLKLAQAAAWAAGEKQTTPEDLTLLTDSLWREPKERPKVAKTVGRLADPVATKATEILDAARETADKANALKSGDRKAYISKCAEILSEFDAQMAKLEKLAHTGGRRAREVIAEASAEITSIHDDMARTVSNGLGLRRAAAGK